MSSFLCGIVNGTIREYFVQPFAYFFCALQRAQDVGGLAGGVYLFPFRTQQSSLLAAMVLAREE